MRRSALVLLFILICQNSFCQQSIDRIPFHLVEKLIFIQLKLNDHSAPLNFMFDSGAGVTVIDTKLGEELELSISGETKIGTAGKPIISKTSDANEIKISEKVILTEVSLYLMDLSHLSDLLKTNVDGIIGYDLLKNFITETNIDESEIRFYSSSDFIYQGNAEPISLIELESDLFGIPMKIQPRGSKEIIPLVVKLDTGAANHLSFHNQFVIKNQLLDIDKKQKIKKGFSIDPTITHNAKGKLSTVWVAGKKWKNIPVVFEIDPINESSKRVADGLIGQDLLLDFNITYNLFEKSVFLEIRN